MFLAPAVAEDNLLSFPLFPFSHPSRWLVGTTLGTNAIGVELSIWEPRLWHCAGSPRGRGSAQVGGAQFGQPAYDLYIVRVWQCVYLYVPTIYCAVSTPPNRFYP